jgi:O-antigen ligase
MTAIALALFRGVSELFADWRNWVVIATTTVVVVKLIEGRSWARDLFADVTLVWGLLSIPLLVTWAVGGGSDLFDIRIPLFNGYNLVLAGLAGFVALERWIGKSVHVTTRYRALSMLSGIAGTLLVALSFRRSYWGYLIVGFVVVLFDAYVRRRVTFDKGVVLAIGAVIVVSTAVATFGLESLTARLESFIPSTDNQYSATNEDHVGDLADAFSVITDEPLFGLGIGQYYETARIAEWKAQSFEVHNAMLGVWLKFGLIGIVTYVGFHVALISAAWRHREDAAGFVGAVAFLVGLQVIALVQTWPYQSFKLSIVHGLLLATLVVNSEPSRRETLPTAPAHMVDAPLARP